MKSIHFIFTILYTLLQTIVSQPGFPLMASVLFGNDEKSPCQDDCKYMHKFRAYFPLDNPDADQTTELNQFTMKFIQVYDDHLSVFKAASQDDAQEMVSNEPFLPKQTDFLNNYPLQSFLLPCKVKLCSVGQFKQLQLQITPGQPFQVDDKILGEVGPNADTQCVLLIQDLLQPKNYFYVCSDNAKLFWQFKLTVEESIFLLPFEEQAAMMQWVSASNSELQTIYFHMDKEQIVANNNDKNIKSGPEEPGYQEFFKHTFGVDFFDPAATNIGKQKLEVQWEGDPDKKPIGQRCFRVNIKQQQVTGLVDMGYNVMCIIENADGSKPMSVLEAAQISEQWVEKINTQNSLAILDVSRDFFRKCVNPDCTSTITSSNKMVGPIYITIHLKALMVDEICNSVVKQKIMPIEQCEQKKETIIVNQIEYLCERNMECMKLIANDIEEGNLPLIEEGNRVSWDPLNPYRELDAANKESPPPVIPKAQDDTSNMSEAQKEINKIQREIGVPLDVPLVQVTSVIRPSLLDIQKSVGTLQGILQGKNVDDLKKLNSVCTPAKDTPAAMEQARLKRSISLVPFITRFDPWLEYCGYIRDVQSKQ